MSTGITAPAPPTREIGPTKRWTTAEFDRLLADGYIREGSRTYLWNGEIIEPMPENRARRNALANLCRLLQAMFPREAWTLDWETPIELRDGYKPQPDIMVLLGPRSRYRARVPNALDVVLLVEVADSSYSTNRGEFLREYAAAGVPRYWIVNLSARRVEVYETPQLSESGPPGYRDRTEYDLEQAVPFDLTHEGSQISGRIAVRDVLVDSLDLNVREGPA